MPIYEYQCNKCGQEFELRRTYSESDAAAACPKCGGEGKKLLSIYGSKQGMYITPSENPPLRSSSRKD